MLRTLARSLLPQRLTDRIRGSPLPFTWSYSQEGEDMVLNRFFEKQSSGFYVDVGAHHPIRYSNTFLLYRRGWRGINVDAMPGSMEPFKRLRPRDINIEAAISDIAEVATYHVFNDAAINSFDSALSEERDGENGYRIVQRLSISTQRLESLLQQHLPANQRIDMMSVDVEGRDVSVLRSNNWLLYRPTVLLVEDMGVSGWKGIAQSDVSRFLSEKRYEPMASTLHTVFYLDQDQLEAAAR